MPSDYEYYGRCAFEAFKLDHGNLYSDGTVIPLWDDLPESDQAAWVAAGNAAVNAYKGE